MNRVTKILILENNPNHVSELENELAKSYKDYTTLVVNSEQEFQDALSEFIPDIILSEYTHPVFDWNAAFLLKERTAPTIPFILVSGTADGDDALEIIKKGVTDYVFKDKPDSLVPKIVRALSEAEKQEVKRAEELTLKNSIADLRAIFDNTDVGFVFISKEFKILAYNLVSSCLAEKMLNIKLQSNWNFKELLLTDRLQEFNVFASTVFDGQAMTHEASYPDSDGSLMWFTISGRPIMNDEGVMGMCISITDITERKQAEERLRRSEERYRQIVETAREGIWVLDENNRTTFANKIICEMFEYSHKEMMDKPMIELMNDEGKVIVAENIEKQKQGIDLEHGYEFPYVTKSGKNIWTYLSTNPIYNEAGKYTGALIMVTDITHRKKSQDTIKELNESLEVKVVARTQELTDANIALEAFSYSVSHDLRAPVRAMLGFSGIIRKEYGDKFTTDLTDLFSHIESSGKRMNAIIEDLLVLAKNGKDKLNMEMVDIHMLFTNVWENLLSEVPHKPSLELKPLPLVYADSSMLQQAIVNLLSNAIKYSSKSNKPHIEVGSIQGKDKLTFYVKDNGAGFDMKYYDKLFGAFQRLHDTREFEGTGIGLSLIKRIIERHDGEVWAEGKVGEGASFFFSLPLVVAA